MKKIYTLLVSTLLLLLINLELIAQPVPDWTKLYAGPTGKGAAGRHVRVVNGYVYVAGTGSGTHVLRYDSQNPLAPAITMTYTGAEYPYDLEVDGSGNVYVAARSVASSKGTSVPNYDYVTIKFKSDGSLHWARTYAGSKGASDCPLGLAIDGTGNVYVTGGADGINNTNAFAAAVTLKYNSIGELQWTARLDDINPGQLAVAGAPYESANDITIDQNGDVYITGESNRGMLVAKYSGSYAGTGLNPVIWKDVVTEGTNGRTIGVTDGNIIASGWGGAIASFTSAGIRNWVKDYGAEFWDMTLANSAIYTTGFLGREMYTAKYDLQGNFIWEGRISSDATARPCGRGITVDECDNTYVTGFIEVQEGRNSVSKLPLIKYGPSGSKEWETRSAGSGFDVETDGTGAVYVTGEQYNNRVVNFITVKYPSGCTLPQVVQPFSTIEENGSNYLANYPNPFKLSTNISFRLTKAGFVSLNVYDLSGRKIQTLVQEKRNAGQHNVKFSGNNLPSGTYIYRLELEGYTKTGRMILEK